MDPIEIYHWSLKSHQAIGSWILDPAFRGRTLLLCRAHRDSSTESWPSSLLRVLGSWPGAPGNLWASGGSCYRWLGDVSIQCTASWLKGNSTGIIWKAWESWSCKFSITQAYQWIFPKSWNLCCYLWEESEPNPFIGAGKPSKGECISYGEGRLVQWPQLRWKVQHHIKQIT